jgi:hypothetical protein
MHSRARKIAHPYPSAFTAAVGLTWRVPLRCSVARVRRSSYSRCLTRRRLLPFLRPSSPLRLRVRFLTASLLRRLMVAP